MGYRKIVVAVCAAALVLAGCDSGGVQGQPAASTPEVQSPVADSSSAAPPKKNDGGGGAITPSGTKLKFGKTATVKYAIKDQSKVSTKLAATVVSVRKGKIEDMKDFNLDAQTKVSEPFYVTRTFRNVGPKPMQLSSGPCCFYVYNTAGDELNSLSLLGDFQLCQGLAPKTLAVGKSYTECDVYVAPKGQNVSKVLFGFYLDAGASDRTEITWTK